MVFTTSPIKKFCCPTLKFILPHPFLSFSLPSYHQSFFCHHTPKNVYHPTPNYFLTRLQNIFADQLLFLPLQPKNFAFPKICLPIHNQNCCHPANIFLLSHPQVFATSTSKIFYYLQKIFLPSHQKSFLPPHLPKFLSPHPQKILYFSPKNLCNPNPKSFATLPTECSFLLYPQKIVSHHPTLKKNVCHYPQKMLSPCSQKFFATHPQCLFSWSLACLASRVLGFTHVKNYQKMLSEKTSYESPINDGFHRFQVFLDLLLLNSVVKSEEFAHFILFLCI